MAGGEEHKFGGGEGGDFYSVLGLDKECSTVELKSAYKKLALRWHPDRCSASDSAQVVDRAKNKFQEIQEAYAGFYHSDDDDNGMGDFLGEMATMMNNHKPDQEKSVQQTFQELQDLFMEMLQSEDDSRSSGGTKATTATTTGNNSKPPLRTTSLPVNFASMPRGSTTFGLKRECADMNSGASRPRTAPPTPGFDDPFTSSGGTAFCFGVASGGGGGSGRFSAPSPQRGSGPSGKSSGITHAGVGGGRSRRNGRKQKVSSRHDDVSSWDSSGVSAS